jgi:hypothetical protein
MSWITIDRNSLGLDAIHDERTTTSGAQTYWKPSAFDVPEAIQFGYDSEHSQLVIRFRYIAQEGDLVENILEPTNARVTRGRNSGRIYGITIPFAHCGDESSLSAAIADVVSALRVIGDQRRGGVDRAKILRARVAERVVSQAPRLAGEANLRCSAGTIRRWENHTGSISDGT